VYSKNFHSSRPMSSASLDDPNTVSFGCKGTCIDGQACWNPVPKGKAFCPLHDREVKKCASPTKGGKDCKKLPLKGNLCCSTHKHFEETARARAENISQIASDLDDVKRTLDGIRIRVRGILARASSEETEGLDLMFKGLSVTVDGIKGVIKK